MTAKVHNNTKADLSSSKTPLAKKVKQTEERLQASCGWAVSMCETLEPFQNEFYDTVSRLEQLEEFCSKHKTTKAQRQQIGAVLRRLRKYSRKMADQSKPLTVLGIIWDLERMNELATLVKRLLAEIKRSLRDARKMYR
jgi:hypothetical protein